MLLGAGLFVLRSWIPEPPATLVVSEERLLQIVAEWQSHSGVAPDAEQRRDLLAQAVDEELLLSVALDADLEHRDPELRRRLIRLARFVADDPKAGEEELFDEALALDLHRKDLTARERLVEGGRYLLSGGDDLPAPTDAELETFLEDHRDEIELPERTAVIQLLFTAANHADPLAAARSALDELAARGLGPDAVELPGDGGSLPTRPGLLPHLTLVRRFGEAFADLAFRAEPGRWQGPVESSWGAHLLWVEERQPASLPKLDEARDELTRAWTDELRKRNLEQSLAELRRHRTVIVEHPPGFEAGS